MMCKGKILIVEDNAINLEMVKILLEDAGYEALEALDADTGIQKAEAEHPALVLMDIHLPHKNGLEATQILKANPLTCDIPVVAFTALSLNGDRQRVLEAGCNGIMVKPINITSFVTELEQYLPLSVSL